MPAKPRKITAVMSDGKEFNMQQQETCKGTVAPSITQLRAATEIFVKMARERQRATVKGSDLNQ